MTLCQHLESLHHHHQCLLLLLLLQLVRKTSESVAAFARAALLALRGFSFGLAAAVAAAALELYGIYSLAIAALLAHHLVLSAVAPFADGMPHR